MKKSVFLSIISLVVGIGIGMLLTTNAALKEEAYLSLAIQEIIKTDASERKNLVTTSPLFSGIEKIPPLSTSQADYYVFFPTESGKQRFNIGNIFGKNTFGFFLELDHQGQWRLPDPGTLDRWIRHHR